MIWQIFWNLSTKNSKFWWLWRSAGIFFIVRVCFFSSFQNPEFLTLANYLHLLSNTYSFKIYEIFKFFNQTNHKQHLQLNDNINEVSKSFVNVAFSTLCLKPFWLKSSNCFQVFEPIWTSFHELCCRISSNTQNVVDRELYFTSTFYLKILKELKTQYEK